MTRCAECGAPGAEHALAAVDKRLASEMRYCRGCYERLAARLMRPTEKVFEEFRERMDERT